MALNVGELVGTISLDMKPWDSSIHKAQGDLGRLGTDGAKKSHAAGALIGGAIGAGLLMGLGKLKTFATGSVDAFAAVEDATGAAGVQFGKGLPAVLAFADKASGSFGMSQRAALEAQNTFGTLGKAAGLQGAPLAGFSGKLAGLAGDLASFKGTSTEQAIGAVGAALRGEMEPIRAYGVLLDDQTLRQEALKMGLIKNVKEGLTPQQKALAAQSAILKQTKDAQGDYARTSDSTANTQKTLAAETENAQVALGQKLAPAVTWARTQMLGLITFVTDTAIPGLQKFGGFITNLFTAFKTDGISGVIAKLGPMLSSALPIIQAKLSEWGTAFVAWIGPMIPPFLAELGKLWVKLETCIWGTALPAIAAQLVKWGKAFVEWIGPMIPPFLTELGILLGALGTWVLNTGVPWLFEHLKTWAVAFVKWIGPMIPPVLLELGKLLVKLAWWLVSVALPALTQKFAGWSRAFWSWVPGAALSLLGEMGKLLGKLAVWILTTALPAIVSKVAEWRGAFLSWVGGVIVSLPGKLAGLLGTIVTWARGVPGKILSGLGNLGSLLYDKGKAIIQGLINGIGSMVGNLASAVGNAIQKGITDLLPGSPVKKGPLRVLNNGYAGGQIVKMLAYGIDSQQSTLDAQMAGLVKVPSMAWAIKVPSVPKIRGLAAETAPAAMGGFGPAASGPAMLVERMTVIGYDPDEAVRKFGREVKWALL